MQEDKRHIGLFAGGGGFELAAQWNGYKTVAWCEWDTDCQRLLKYYFPGAQGYGDITKSCFKKYANTIDLLTGGFPCQPYSNAGRRKGKEDVRHLWPEMLRAIREIQPTYVVGENVPGLVNWNEGLVFEEVCLDLENEGFQVQPVLLPACSISAPHIRERVWFIAYSNRNEHNRKTTIGGYYSEEGESESQGSERERLRDGLDRNEEKGIITNTVRLGQSGPRRTFQQFSEEAYRDWKASWSYDDDRWPTQSPVCGGDDGLSGTLDGITFSDWSKFSLKVYGNAIVPQLADLLIKNLDIVNTSTPLINKGE